MSVAISVTDCETLLLSGRCRQGCNAVQNVRWLDSSEELCRVTRKDSCLTSLQGTVQHWLTTRTILQRFGLVPEEDNIRYHVRCAQQAFVVSLLLLLILCICMYSTSLRYEHCRVKLRGKVGFDQINFTNYAHFLYCTPLTLPSYMIRP